MGGRQVSLRQRVLVSILREDQQAANNNKRHGASVLGSDHHGQIS